MLVSVYQPVLWEDDSVVGPWFPALAGYVADAPTVAESSSRGAGSDRGVGKRCRPLWGAAECHIMGRQCRARQTTLAYYLGPVRRPIKIQF